MTLKLFSEVCMIFRCYLMYLSSLGKFSSVSQSQSIPMNFRLRYFLKKQLYFFFYKSNIKENLYSVINL